MIDHSRDVSSEPNSGKVAPTQLSHYHVSAMIELVSDVHRVITTWSVVFEIFLVFSHDGCRLRCGKGFGARLGG